MLGETECHKLVLSQPFAELQRKLAQAVYDMIDETPMEQSHVS